MIYDPKKAGRLIFPHFLEAIELFSTVNRAKLAWIERRRCYHHLLKWCWTNLRFMRKDIREGVVWALRRHLSDDDFQRMKAAKQRVFGANRDVGR